MPQRSELNDAFLASSFLGLPVIWGVCLAVSAFLLAVAIVLPLLESL